MMAGTVGPGLTVRWIDRKVDSPQKIVYIKVQNIHTYPLCKTTRHLITSTKRRPKIRMANLTLRQSGINQNLLYNSNT